LLLLRLLSQVYSPSTIAVFGANSPKDNTPNDTIMQPSTIYGVTKVGAELL
jgi:nucleoside-diphosphate-sugar epimerase